MQGLRQCLNRRVVQPPECAEHAEWGVSILVKDSKLQASLTFVGEKSEADLDGAADGVVPVPRVLFVERARTEVGVLLERPVERVIDAVPESDLLDQTAVGKLQQQGHAFEAIGQQRDPARS